MLSLDSSDFSIADVIAMEQYHKAMFRAVAAYMGIKYEKMMWWSAIRDSFELYLTSNL